VLARNTSREDAPGATIGSRARVRGPPGARVRGVVEIALQRPPPKDDDHEPVKPLDLLALTASSPKASVLFHTGEAEFAMRQRLMMPTIGTDAFAFRACIALGTVLAYFLRTGRAAAMAFLSRQLSTARTQPIADHVPVGSLCTRKAKQTVPTVRYGWLATPAMRTASYGCVLSVRLSYMRGVVYGIRFSVRL
jgi:hypothetical protein